MKWALALTTMACFAAATNAATPQTEPPKPPPAAEKKPQAAPQHPDSSRATRREAPGTNPREERPRSDVPVSFPVDI
jgi:hypothetical protein